MGTRVLGPEMGGLQPTVSPFRRADVHDAIVSGLLMVFLVFFFVGERIETLAIPIRVEDLVFILLLPFGYRYLAYPKTRLFYWVAAYFAVNLIPYLAAAAGGQYELSYYPLIVVKELQYFYIAFLICENRSRLVLGTVDALAVFIVANGVRAALAGEITYYGIGTFGNYTAPSLAGALFLFSTIWLHIRSRLLSNRALRWGTMGVVVLGAGCVVATVSRSSIAALLAYVGTYLLLTRVLVFPAFLVALAASPKILQALAVTIGAGYGLLAFRVIMRAGYIGSAAADRAGKWQEYLGAFAPIDFVFGRGKGYPNALGSGFGLGVDSQYVRLIMENGIVGMALVGLIIWTILRGIKRRSGEWEHAWAVVLAMLVMAIPLEALQVSKSGGFFWLIMFYLYMCQRRSPLPRAAI